MNNSLIKPTILEMMAALTILSKSFFHIIWRTHRKNLSSFGWSHLCDANEVWATFLLLLLVLISTFFNIKKLLILSFDQIETKTDVINVYTWSKLFFWKLIDFKNFILCTRLWSHMPLSSSSQKKPTKKHSNKNSESIVIKYIHSFLEYIHETFEKKRERERESSKIRL